MMRTLRSTMLAASVLVPGLMAQGAPAQEASPPARHPAQRIPSAPEFPTGPALGERLPDFRLPNQHGEMVDFHADRGASRAAVLFQRSAVW